MKIKLFSTEGCAGCVVVKKLLDDKGVVYETFDVMNVDHMAEASKFGVRGIPTIVIESGGVETIVTGSKPSDIERIKQALGV